MLRFSRGGEVTQVQEVEQRKDGKAPRCSGRAGRGGQGAGGGAGRGMDQRGLAGNWATGEGRGLPRLPLPGVGAFPRPRSGASRKVQPAQVPPRSGHQPQAPRAHLAQGL